MLDEQGGQIIMSLAALVRCLCSTVKHEQLEKVAINDVLPLKTARRDAIAKLKSLFGACFESELQTNPMPFHLDSTLGVMLTPLRAFAMNWDGTEQ